MNDTLIYLNGKYLNKSEAVISIFDRGFLFGDAIYEVIPFYHNQLAFSELHFQRFKRSLELTKIPFPDIDYPSIIHTLIKQSGIDNGQIYIAVTRGNQMKRSHDIPANLSPTVLAFVMDLPFPTDAQRNTGITGSLIPDNRWNHCDIKTTSLIANILANDAAVKNGDNIAILHRNGIVTESSAANVFIVNQDNIVLTHPANECILNGITRLVVLSILVANSLPHEERAFTINELFEAKEVWITGTTKEIFPVIKIDGIPIPSLHPDAIWRKILSEFHLLERNES